MKKQAKELKRKIRANAHCLKEGAKDKLPEDLKTKADDFAADVKAKAHSLKHGMKDKLPGRWRNQHDNEVADVEQGNTAGGEMETEVDVKSLPLPPSNAEAGCLQGVRKGFRRVLGSCFPCRSSVVAGNDKVVDVVHDSSLPQEDKVRHLMSLVQVGGALECLSAFAKSYCDESFCVRLLNKYRGDIQVCTKKLGVALRWRERNEKLLTTLEFREATDLRVIGSDLIGRPVLYQCARNQMLSNVDGMDQTIVRCMQAVDLMPEGVETMTHVWDLHGLKLHLNLSPSPLLELLEVLEGYLAERTHQIIIIDLPGLANFLVKAVWPLVPESTKKKIKFLSAKEAKLQLPESCGDTVAHRIEEAMALNRVRNSTLEQRRITWMQVDKSGSLLHVAA